MKWPKVRLEQIAVISGGGTPRRNNDSFWGGNVVWATPTDLPMPGCGIEEVSDTADRITRAGLDSCSAHLLPKGTVLFSSRATIGKIGIAQVPLATNQGFINFIPREHIDCKYLAYTLQHLTPQLISLSGSTTFKEVGRGAVKKFLIPLPPLSEQRRIVEILDQADHLRKMRTEADKKAERILPALFIKMFGDLATNPKGWDVYPLGELVDIGTKLVNPNKEEYQELPHIGGENIESHTGRILSFEKVANCRLRSSKFLFSAHHVLYSKIRPYLNKVAFPQLRGLCSADIYPLVPKSDRISSWYLVFLLRTKAFLDYAQVHSDRLRIPKLNKDQISAFNIPVPDQKSLELFEHKANEFFNLEKSLTIREQTIEILFSILLHQAFSGNLTASWRQTNMKELLQEMEIQAKALAS